MAATHLTHAIRHLRRSALLPDGGGMTDGQLLGCFIADQDEDAFAALVRRHGPMVLATCRRVLHHAQDAEDAFQATFLVLARKASSLAQRDLVANWLYGVAYRAALQARAARPVRERQVHAMPEPEVSDDVGRWTELQRLLDRELTRLPERLRVPVVLCDLQGRTRRDAARHLGIPEGTLSGRLTMARRTLARRLGKHGMAWSGAALGLILAERAASASVPAALVLTTTKAGATAATGTAAADVSARVTALTEGVLKTMLLDKLRIAAVTVLATMMVVCGVTQLTWPTAVAQQPQKQTDATTQQKEKGPHWQLRTTLAGHGERCRAARVLRGWHGDGIGER